MKKRFANKTVEVIGKPYCAQGFKDGYDCFSLVINFLRESGVELPENMTWNGLTFRSYYKLWEQDPDNAIAIMKQFLEEFAGRKSLKDLMVGDILVVKNASTGVTFCAIYGGNDKIVTSDMRYGVVGLPLRHFRVLDIFKGSK